VPYSSIIFQKKNHIARIIMNKPSEGNIITGQMGQEIEEACKQINGDEDVYVVIITGAGDVFSKGSELEKSFQSELKHYRRDSDIGTQISIIPQIAAIEKPVIAALNGDAIGQGLELALACDLRIASDKAHFGFPDVGMGVIPTDGGTQLLPRIIGKGKALELILTADIIDAKEALEIGLVTEVVPVEKLTAEVDTLAKSIASKAPIALRYIKEAVGKGLDMTLAQGLRLEADLYFLLHTTTDRTEGVKAFLQKRPPEFKGK
jgi:enoyl-CoA hydratase